MPAQMDVAGFEIFLQRQNVSDYTLRTYLSFVTKINDFVEKFDENEVNRFLAWKLKTLSGAGANKYIKAIRKYGEFKHLEWTKNVTKLKENPAPRVLFSDTEIEEFISLEPPNYTEDTVLKYKVFWSILAYSGMRPKECLKLRQEHIDLSNNLFLLYDTKTKDGRSVPIVEIILPLIQDYLKTIETNFLFPGNKDQPMSNTAYLKDFYIRKKMMGVTKNVKPYGLRHSLISRLVDAEAPLFVVQDIVGHKSSETTRQYYHGSLKAMRKAIQKDPLTRASMNPKLIAEQIVKLIKEILAGDKRFNVEIVEKDKSLSIKISWK